MKGISMRRKLSEQMMVGLTRGYLLGGLLWGATFVAGAFFGGCVTLTASRSAAHSIRVPDAPAIASQKATRAAMAIGAQITHHDPQALSARLNKAVILNVSLTPQGTGTILTVQATAEPGYILPHDVPEDVQAFVTAYGKQ
jgi:hypothetical protein